MQASTDGPLARFIGQAINVAVVVLLCDLAWIAIKTFIARQLLATPAHEGEAASRLSTLLPMIRTTAMIVLGGLVTLVALSALGVNIAPLLAGAGVVGLAIGFGAQTLVRDVITGVFFLIEDAFRVGEYIDVGARKGTVEAISLRSLRLRHQRGALHTVPFGEIKSLSNESRDWSIVKLEFRIPFDTDLGKVKKIIKLDQCRDRRRSGARAEPDRADQEPGHQPLRGILDGAAGQIHRQAQLLPVHDPPRGLSAHSRCLRRRPASSSASAASRSRSPGRAAPSARRRGREPP